jgi:hypothetical protein
MAYPDPVADALEVAFEDEIRLLFRNLEVPSAFYGGTEFRQASEGTRVDGPRASPDRERHISEREKSHLRRDAKK